MLGLAYITQKRTSSCIRLRFPEMRVLLLFAAGFFFACDSRPGGCVAWRCGVAWLAGCVVGCWLPWCVFYAFLLSKRWYGSSFRFACSSHGSVRFRVCVASWGGAALLLRFSRFTHGLLVWLKWGWSYPEPFGSLAGPECAHCRTQCGSAR